MTNFRKEAEEWTEEDELLLIIMIPFASGCFSGRVSEWPQLKPLISWAYKKIKGHRGALQSFYDKGKKDEREHLEARNKKLGLHDLEHCLDAEHDSQWNKYKAIQVWNEAIKAAVDVLKCAEKHKWERLQETLTSKGNFNPVSIPELIITLKQLKKGEMK